MRKDSRKQRREFLGKAAAGSAALLVAGASTAFAAPPAPQGGAVLPQDGEWLAKLHGAHRQYFDIISWNSGFGQGYSRNWTSTMKSTYGLADADVCAVLGMRHNGIAPAFKDLIWEKYRLGAFFNITDPRTRQPSTRNFAYHDAGGDFPFPGGTLEQLISAGAVVVVCDLATNVMSRQAAAAAGLSVTPAEAYAEFKANLQPGCYLVPSGVLAVNRAQAVGNCSYCFAG